MTPRPDSGQNSDGNRRYGQTASYLCAWGLHFSSLLSGAPWLEKEPEWSPVNVWRVGNELLTPVGHRPATAAMPVSGTGGSLTRRAEVIHADCESDRPRQIPICYSPVRGLGTFLNFSEPLCYKMWRVMPTSWGRVPITEK